MNIVNFKIGTRLVAGCALILATLAGLAWLGSEQMAVAQEPMHESIKVNEMLSPQTGATVTPCIKALRSRWVGDPSGMFDSEMQRHETTTAEAQRAGGGASAMMLIMAACAMAVACVITWAITRRINLAKIASGKLDLSSRDGHQASLLAELASTVKQHAARLHEGSRQDCHASDAGRKVEAIKLASQKFSDIVRAIDAISAQTNILALHAALEAARAGQQGRGFAIVASEVRYLAARSGAAAREINQLLQKSADSAQAGSELLSKAVPILTGVVDSVQRVTQIMVAVNQMHNGTQQHAALVEESAAAAAALRDQAGILARLVSSLKLDACNAQGGAVS